MVQGFPNTAYYFSTMNGALTEFKADIDSRAGWSGFAYDGFDDRAMPTSLVGAEYYLANSGDTSNVPYGFDKYLRDREAVAYKNRYALPLGFVYESTIARSDLERLDPVGGHGAMLQGAVVDDADVGLATRITPTAEAVEVPYSVVAEEGARFDRSAGTITRFRRGSRFGVVGATRTECRDLRGAEGHQERWPVQVSRRAAVVPRFDTATRRTRVGRLAELGVHHLLGRSRVQARELEVTAVSLLLRGNRSQLVNLGYQPSGLQTITISPERVGKLTFESLKVLACPWRSIRRAWTGFGQARCATSASPRTRCREPSPQTSPASSS